MNSRARTLCLVAAIATIPSVAVAHMVIEDAYARASSSMAQSGAAFMSIFNHNDYADRLIAVESDVAERVELHTHIEDTGGVMRMIEVEDGFPMEAGETIELERGGLHIMLLGLTRPLEQGDEIEATFIFETSDPVTQTIIVDNERMPASDHGEHDHNHSHDAADEDEHHDDHDHGDSHEDHSHDG